MANYIFRRFAPYSLLVWWDSRSFKNKFLFILAACVCIVGSFAVGIRSTYAQDVYNYPAMFDACSAKLQEYAQENETLTKEKSVVVPYSWSTCMRDMTAFYITYPRYHFEDDDQTISIDIPLSNPREEAAQVCAFLLYEFPTMPKQ